MGIERERKFLVTGDAWRAAGRPFPIRQGYLCNQRERSVRVRVCGEEAFLTIKGETEGDARPEFEYPIPPADATAILDTLCARPQIEKTRYLVEVDGRVWEVDEFAGDNEGLIVAEIEFAEEGERLTLPDWVGAEVTDDPRYLNVNLVRHPFRAWRERN